MLDSATRIWPYWLRMCQGLYHLLVISIEVLLCSKRQLTWGSSLLSNRAKLRPLAAPGQRWGLHVAHECTGWDLATKVCGTYIASAPSRIPTQTSPLTVEDILEGAPLILRTAVVVPRFWRYSLWTSVKTRATEVQGMAVLGKIRVAWEGSMNGGIRMVAKYGYFLWENDWGTFSEWKVTGNEPRSVFKEMDWWTRNLGVLESFYVMWTRRRAQKWSRLDLFPLLYERKKQIQS